MDTPGPVPGIINLDAPHMVDTGGCCASCYEPKTDLMRCGACLHAWYCSRDCQRAHFKAHKAQCKVLKLFSELHADLPKDIRPKNAQEFYTQRMAAQELVSKVMGRPLTRAESRAIMSEAKCSVCMSTRDQAEARGSRLVCCRDCHWGWACQGPCATQYLHKGGGHTPQVCATLGLMNATQLLTHSTLRSAGKLPSYCPEGPKNALLPPPPEPFVPNDPTPHSSLASLRISDATTSSSSSGSSSGTWPPYTVPPAGWTAYARWRGLPPLDAPLRALLSKRLSQALTAAYGLQYHYTKEQAAGLERVVIHVVGAGAFEVPADGVWEEVVHVLPPRKGGRVLHVDFVGPEVGDIIVDEEDGLVLPKPMCGACTTAGSTRTYAYHMCTYHDFLHRQEAKTKTAGDAPLPPPTLVVAFNTGMGQEEREVWAPTLRALATSGVPCVFTAYNGEEAEKDVGAWRAAGGALVRGPEENPYRVLDPILEPSKVDEFYFQNYYVYCARGLAGSKPATFMS